MKRSAIALTSTALLATALTTGLALAAPPDRDPEQRLQAMTQQLNLTEAQQTELRALFEQHAQRRAAERQALREQVDALLTDAQRQQRDARMQQRVERRISRMTQRLDLTPDQAQQLHALFAEKQGNPTLTRSELRERMAAVLSEDQLARLERARPRKAAHGPMGRGGSMGCN
ncbi:pilus assembly protein [Thiohalocapsa marina]|uniref:Pilus assembly protein n=1 Tax=Thiohalocapsa marina TaxID=424902 RepID=A0A5M8FMV3_9GAMM|nr:pilus assembly protein [Thiohalocapsa marina]KAA6184471.1 pilus assembly protein [Thiohalocapsa marina]